MKIKAGQVWSWRRWNGSKTIVLTVKPIYTENNPMWHVLVLSDTFDRYKPLEKLIKFGIHPSMAEFKLLSGPKEN